MTIFTANEMLFFFTGVLAIVLIWTCNHLNRHRPFSWVAWVTAIFGGVLLLTAIQWAVSSVLEGEPQAANMGLLVFGVPALLLLGTTGRLVFRQDPFPAGAVEEE